MIECIKSKSLVEKYRPKTWDEVVGQDKIVEMLLAIDARTGFGGRSFWITGKTGTGKTSIGRLIAGQHAESHSIIEMDAGELTPAELRRIASTLHLYGLSQSGEKTGRAVIINEAHGLRTDTMRALLVTLEELPSNAVFVFTTTYEGNGVLIDDKQDARPLITRCVPVQLTTQNIRSEYAKKAKEIAEAEGIGGPNLAAYERLAKECNSSFREMLQQIDAGWAMRRAS